MVCASIVLPIGCMRWLVVDCVSLFNSVWLIELYFAAACREKKERERERPGGCMKPWIDQLLMCSNKSERKK